MVLFSRYSIYPLKNPLIYFTKIYRMILVVMLIIIISSSPFYSHQWHLNLHKRHRTCPPCLLDFRPPACVSYSVINAPAHASKKETKREGCYTFSLPVHHTCLKNNKAQNLNPALWCGFIIFPGALFPSILISYLFLVVINHSNHLKSHQIILYFPHHYTSHVTLEQYS